MAKLGKHIKQNKGKGGGQEMLPSRHARDQLTGGDAFQRSINNYAKVTPSGEGALDAPSVMQMSKVGY